MKLALKDSVKISTLKTVTASLLFCLKLFNIATFCQELLDDIEKNYIGSKIDMETIRNIFK